MNNLKNIFSIEITRFTKNDDFSVIYYDFGKFNG